MSVTRQDLRQLAEATRQMTASFSWKLQTSNSFRRIGAQGDGDVLCATTHPYDHHPDLLAPSGVLNYIVAVQPSAVLELLDQLDAADQRFACLAEVLTDLSKEDIRNSSDAVRAALTSLVMLIDGVVR